MFCRLNIKFTRGRWLDYVFFRNISKDCRTSLAKDVTRCNVSDTNSESLRKVIPFQSSAKPASQPKATQVHKIERCYTLQCVTKLIALRERFHKPLHRLSLAFVKSLSSTFLVSEFRT